VEHARDDKSDLEWAALLNGDDQGFVKFTRQLAKMPRAPRCKLCKAPFAGPFAPMLRLAGFRRWALNQQICKRCIGTLEKHHGGAEVEVSLLYVDIRGSTELAETMSAREFTNLLGSYLNVVAGIVDDHHGVIDHVAGDGVMAFWIPAFTGHDHPSHAASAAKGIAERLGDPESATPIPAGVGAHTGLSYVGVVGEEGSLDFTVLGDPPNTVARLSAAAAPGEVVMSEAIVVAAGEDTRPLEHRVLTLKGKAEPQSVWVWRSSTSLPV
jgi:adenylate cyclase